MAVFFNQLKALISIAGPYSTPIHFGRESHGLAKDKPGNRKPRNTGQVIAQGRERLEKTQAGEFIHSSKPS